jgi:peptidyl-tRNA hydrolase
MLESETMKKEIVKECSKLRRRIEGEQWQDEGQKKIVLQKYAKLVSLLVEP